MDNSLLKKALEDNPFESINDIVYKYLYNAIITLEFKPGSKLSETQIANDLSISRSPVKAAIQRLEHDNLVEQMPGKSPRITTIQYSDCCSIVEARMAIEGFAAYHAAKKISEEELDQLKTILFKFKSSSHNADKLEFVKADANFHKLIVNASKNKYLINAYNLIEGNMLRYRYHIVNKMDFVELDEYENHLPVYISLKNRCSTLAKEEMVASIDRMYRMTYFL